MTDRIDDGEVSVTREPPPGECFLAFDARGAMVSEAVLTAEYASHIAGDGGTFHRYTLVGSGCDGDVALLRMVVNSTMLKFDGDRETLVCSLDRPSSKGQGQ